MKPQTQKLKLFLYATLALALASASTHCQAQTNPKSTAGGTAHAPGEGHTTGNGHLHAPGEGHTTGNGGDVIGVKGKLYLLDLVESGVQEHPYLEQQIVPSSEFLYGIKDEFANFPAPKKLIVAKLTELKKTDPVFAFSMSAAMGMYEWSLVDAPLTPIDDSETVLEHDKGNFFQIAVRIGDRIMINHELWDKLDALNQTALIFHEMVYAAIIPRKTPQGFYVQKSPIARDIVGGIFSPPTETNRVPSQKQDKGRFVLPFSGATGLNPSSELHGVYNTTGTGQSYKLGGLPDKFYGFTFNPYVGVGFQTNLNEGSIEGKWETYSLNAQSPFIKDKTFAEMVKNQDSPWFNIMGSDKNFASALSSRCANASSAVPFVVRVSSGFGGETKLTFRTYPSEFGEQKYIDTNVFTYDTAWFTGQITEKYLAPSTTCEEEVYKTIHESALRPYELIKPLISTLGNGNSVPIDSESLELELSNFLISGNTLLAGNLPQSAKDAGMYGVINVGMRGDLSSSNSKVPGTFVRYTDKISAQNGVLSLSGTTTDLHCKIRLNSSLVESIKKFYGDEAQVTAAGVWMVQSLVPTQTNGYVGTIYQALVYLYLNGNTEPVGPIAF